MATFIGENRLKELLTLIKGKLDNVTVSVSKKEGNQITSETDGMYVAPTIIPTNVSEFTNDSKYQTDTDVATALQPYAKTSALPTKTSQLTNDSNFVVDANYTHIDKATTSNLGIVKPDGTTITVDADGTIHGASSIDNLNDIGDVNIASATDKQVLTYDSATQKWVNKDSSGGGTSDISKEPQNAIVEKTDGIYAFDNMWVGTMQKYLADEPNIADGTNVKITNDTVGGSPIAVAEMDFYSDEEQCIGCWIDGKPIYRRVLRGTTPSSQSLVTITTEGTYGDLISVRGYLICGTNNVRRNLANVALTSNPQQLWSNQINIIDENIVLRVEGGDYVLGRPYVIIVEYTKTTDQTNSFTPSMLTNKIGLENLSESDIDAIIGGIEW